MQDPNRHGAMFLLAFVLKFGLAEVVSAPWAGPFLVSLGELSKPYMVQTIKKGFTTPRRIRVLAGRIRRSKSGRDVEGGVGGLRRQQDERFFFQISAKYF